MRSHPPSPNVISIGAAIAALAMVAAMPASAAVTTVYKCFDRNLGVLYTDQPCRGEQLDIEAGRADPAAIAELQREREALSRAMAQRIADARRTTPYDTPGYVMAPPPPGGEIYYPAGWGYGAPYADDRGRPRNRGGNDGVDRPRASRSVPAVPPNGITNRTFR
ncbi:MAG: hypothetical protein U1F54_14850 [Burkholderiales bacterium]